MFRLYEIENSNMKSDNGLFKDEFRSYGKFKFIFMNSSNQHFPLQIDLELKITNGQETKTIQKKLYSDESSNIALFGLMGNYVKNKTCEYECEVKPNESVNWKFKSDSAINYKLEYDIHIKKTLIEQNIDIEKLTNQLSKCDQKLNEDKINQKTEIVEKENKIKDLMEEIESYINKINSLNKKLSDLKLNNINLIYEIENKNKIIGNVNDFSQENKNIKQNIERINKDNQKLLDENKHQRETISKQTNTIDILHNKNQKMEQLNLKLKKENNSLLGCNDDYNSLEKKSNEIKLNNELLINKNKHLKNDIDLIYKKNQKFKNEIDFIQKNYTKLKNENSTLSFLNDEYILSQANLEKLNLNYKDKIIRLEKNLNECKKDKSEYLQKSAEQLNSKSKTIKELQRQLTQIKNIQCSYDSNLNSKQWKHKVFIRGSLNNTQLNGYYYRLNEYKTPIFKNKYNYVIKRNNNSWILYNQCLYNSIPLYYCNIKLRNYINTPPEFGWNINPDILKHCSTLDNINIFTSNNDIFKTKNIKYLEERNDLLEQQFMTYYSQKNIDNIV